MAVRTGRWSRLARLGGMAAGVAGEAAGIARNALNDGSDAAMARFHAGAAHRLADTLGELKGLPQKVGQVLSMFDGTLPFGENGVYGDILKTLQTRSAPLPWPDIAPQLAEAWRPHIEARGLTDISDVARIDPTAIAAASIGQVHRGTLADGRAVAIKVRYPGVEDALKSDLQNIETMVQSLGSVVPKTDVRPLIDDVTRTFLDELNYEREATHQAACASRFASSQTLVIPAVVTEWSGVDVLVTEWLDGLDGDAARASSAALRNQWGAALWHFTWTSITRDAWLHGDPHPGNFRFLPDGRLGVLDFGAATPLPEAMSAGMRRAAEAAIAGANDDQLLGFVLPAVGLPRDLAPDTARPWATFSRLLFAPMAAPTAFTFSDAYVQALVREIGEAKAAAARTALWKGIPTPTQQGTVVLLRCAMGQAALLARLGVTLDGRAPIH